MWSQKTYLEIAIEGDKEEKEFVNRNNIKEIKVTVLKPRKKKLKRLKTKFEKRFDERGNLIYHKEYLRKKGQLWTCEIRIYNEEDYLIERQDLKNFSKDYTTINKLKYNDNKSQVWIETEEGPRNHKWKYSSSKILNERKQITAQIRTEKDTMFFHYDDEGNYLARSLSKTKFSIENKYNANGNLIENNLFNEVKNIYTLDSIGNCVKSETWESVEGKYVLESWRTLKYSNKLISELIIYDSKDNLKKRIEYSYKKELLTMKKYYNSKNKLEVVDKYEYSFNEK